jgi:hypothetical protein
VSIYLPLLWGSKPRKSLICYGCYGGEKFAKLLSLRQAAYLIFLFLRSGQLPTPCGKPQTQFFSSPGSFPLPVASRRPNFSPVQAASHSVWQAADPIFLRSGQRVRLNLLRGSERLTHHSFKRDNQKIFIRSAVHV